MQVPNQEPGKTPTFKLSNFSNKKEMELIAEEELKLKQRLLNSTAYLLFQPKNEASESERLRYQ
jgi:hypothetical protein